MGESLETARCGKVIAEQASLSNLLNYYKQKDPHVAHWWRRSMNEHGYKCEMKDI